jgi:hypothetical protein
MHVGAGCSRSEVVRGELVRGGQSLTGLRGDSIETPMGTFEWRDSQDENGWFYKLWPQHMPTPGAWPCPT